MKNYILWKINKIFSFIKYFIYYLKMSCMYIAHYDHIYNHYPLLPNPHDSAPIHSFALSPFVPHPPSSYISCTTFFLYITALDSVLLLNHGPHSTTHTHKYVNDYFTLSMNTFRIFHLLFMWEHILLRDDF